MSTGCATDLKGTIPQTNSPIDLHTKIATFEGTSSIQGTPYQIIPTYHVIGNDLAYYGI